MKINYIMLLLILVSVSLYGQMYTSDSIVYRYAGSGDPDEEARYLKQFGCIDKVTDSVIVDRNGDYIQVVTKLKKDGNLQILTFTSQNHSAFRMTELEDGTKMGLQMITGYAKGHIYHKELDYFDPINLVESPYMSINWIEYDSNGDGVYERLECKIINSLNIVQSIHCHLNE